jgi:death-on-curing protein
MIYLSPTQVLFIHARLLAETGGVSGVRAVGLLESAVARPRATFDGVDLYPTLCDKAAALMESLVVNHPFIEGDKRTAITAAALFLWRNGYQVTAANAELEQFAQWVILDRPKLSAIAGWIQSHTEAVR